MKQLVEIPAPGHTIAMRASTLKELIKQLNIPAEKFEEAANNPPTAEEQKEAALKIGLEMNKVNEIMQEEARVTSAEIEPISFVNLAQKFFLETEATQTTEEATEPETLTNPTNKNDDDSSNPAEESQEDKEEFLATQFQIQQFVVPVIADRINTYGKADKDTQSIVYKSEEYTASLKLEKDSQTLSLDRNSSESTEIQKALLASRDNHSEEYSITINNLTKSEFERFKILFQDLQVRREQKQQQVQTQDSGNELS
ncbi:MAG: hypothetical protein SAK29_28050 [Scytonema sp. PMC 1069.18]|nr:hypothetical protein [Scytonema sp. PMC 1069.18]MEC4880964.1 hypothetical protein [Scytonema sp. PMC 1070.18]